ncbi:hypothetical protein BASA83_009497 [Batrachochytrium salamandrivorans]|nr:hypothetical protein BASA83_009497 [Batrachochytrium salamandrivorans]
MEFSSFGPAIALCALVLQSTLLVLVLKYVQTTTIASSNLPYLKPTVILLAELLKLVCSLYLYKAERSSITKTCLSPQQHLSYTPPITPAFKPLPTATTLPLSILLFGPNSQWMKLAVPACLYFAQNCLLYTAADRLDSSTFQVLAQSKLLTTAIFSALILGHSIPLPRAIALAILTAGIALVHWSDLTHTAFTVDVVTDDDAHLGDFSYASDRAIGLFYLLLASILSGLAGVWFEKVLKEHKTSVWLRNIQLSLFTLPFGLITLAYMDSKRIWEGGIFQGFTLWTIVIVILQALGGLIVAIVVKSADNIVKGFATCISIVLSSLLSVWLFGNSVSHVFMLGVTLVIGSTLLYAHGEMQFGVAKCGIIGFTGHLAPRLDSPLDIRLHGQLVSRVESYKYFGVLIDSKLDHSAWLKQKQSALEHTISALHPVLASHQLTVNYRSRIFSAVVMGKAYYGLELVGGNKSHLAPLQTTINKGIRLFTGARLSTAIGPLLVETGIKSLLTRSLVSRVRLLERSVTKRTPINAICSGTDNDVFTLNVQGAVGKIPALVLVSSDQTAVQEQIPADTTSQTKDSQATTLVCIDGDSANMWRLCIAPKLLSTSIAHLVVECEQVTGHRIQSGLVPAIQKSRLRLLGRSTRSRCGECIYLAPRWGLKWRSRSGPVVGWMGLWSMNLWGRGMIIGALVARLADFLQVAHRQYQSALWHNTTGIALWKLVGLTCSTASLCLNKVWLACVSCI